VERLLKDGLGLVDLELCLEVVDVVGHGEAVGAAAWVDKGKVLVGNVVAVAAPVVVPSQSLVAWMLGVGPARQSERRERGRTSCLDHHHPS